MKWIQFIDSGGQLQYHDILPLFVQNNGVAIFVLKLSEKLSDHPTIEYYGADGNPVGRPYRSSLSHKEILQKCIGAMHLQDAAKCSSDPRPQIIVVGTHPDDADKCVESIIEKNEQLKALLDPDSIHVLYKGEKLKELIFPINGKAPQDVDRRLSKDIKRKIMSLSPPKRKVPIAWFGLEYLLLSSSDDGILSIIQCQTYAKELQLEGESFSAALHHLIEHNIFLYFPKVLPQTVFCNPQVVLDKVTELVKYHHKLLDDPDEKIPADGNLVKFKNHGLVWVELLSKFHTCYKEGLFTPQDMLKLLVSVHAIAKVTEDGKYLMPALLSSRDASEVIDYIHHGSSLVIRFVSGCNPSGMFCCLVAHLLSQSNVSSPWKVCTKGGTPVHLYRNFISFTRKGTQAIVTLVDMLSYIIIHVNKYPSPTCKAIRDCIHSSIRSACSVLKYQDAQIEDAFICTGADCTSEPLHVAIVEGEPANMWRCSKIDYQTGDLSREQLMWLTDTNNSKQDSTESGKSLCMCVIIDGNINSVKIEFGVLHYLCAVLQHPMPLVVQTRHI